ncbi:MAG: radical SAM protein, partial [Oscillospiraceae bacterium]|nr:radical SAM protein [Oscillospiraceae bacterium]
KALDAVSGDDFKLQLTGGEPLMNLPLVERVLEDVSSMPNCRGVAIQTNGTLIDGDTAKLLKKRRVAIGVSLDGKPETNERQRGGTKAAIEGIERLCANGIAVNINCTVTSDNAENLSETADMAAYLGNVRGIGLDLLRKSGRAVDSQAAGETELLTGLERLFGRVAEINRLLPPERKIVVREYENAKRLLNGKQQPYNGSGSPPYCYASLGKSYTVLADGECYPCGSLAGDARYRMGNVHSAVRSLAIRCEAPEECGGCSYKSVCTGCCPSRGLLNGGFNATDCIMKKYIFGQIKEAKK